MKSDIKTTARIGLLAVALLWCGQAKADHQVLYAGDGKALYTVDLDTAALTFQSDGPLHWLASPAFDDQHHTRLWVVGNEPGGYGWLPSGGASFFYGNPVTGEYGGPYPATVTHGDDAPVSFFDNVLVYAPTTERLYALGVCCPSLDLNGVVVANGFAVAMVDQYAGPPITDGSWVGVTTGFTGSLSSLAVAFDPISGLLVGAYSSTVADAYRPANAVRFWSIEPARGTAATDGQRNWWFSVKFPEPTFIQAMAVDPESGALYGLFHSQDSPDSLFARITPATAEGVDNPTFTFSVIGLLPYAPWSLAFASGQYIR